MKLGFGLYRHMLDDEHLRFARQCGATHVVVHLVDYFKQSSGSAAGDQPVGDAHGWGVAGDPEELWTVEQLRDVKQRIESHGLIWEAAENFDPAHWHDVLLDGPNKARQLEGIKTMIRNLAEVGVRIVGYNFSLAGVAGRIKGPFARGGAEAVGMDGPVNEPIPAGMVWNMWYDTHAAPGTMPPTTSEQLWQRCAEFLEATVPVAEQVGVRLAAHPDDPPLEMVRAQPRLVHQPQLFQKLLDLKPSPANALELCVGTMAEMHDGDLYEAIDQYSRQGNIAYVHLRNVRGKAPHYRETFIDEGDVDVRRVLEILHRNGFDGVIIPDHAPQMTCDAPWHAGMAFAMGYLKAQMQEVMRHD